MTTDDRVRALEAIGFQVMRVPYGGGLFYMRRLLPDGTWDQRQRDGRQYSIELASGRWCCWGDGTWHDW